MYINCYHEDEIHFEHHGEFKVFVGSDDNNIYRALNGQCYATFKVSLDDPYVSYLKPRMLVKLPTPKRENPMQLFRILDFTDDGDGIEFTAFPLLWDLATGFIPHLNSVAKTRLEAAQYILDKALETKPHRITVIEKQVHTEQKNLQIVRSNPLVALVGDKDNTLLNRYPTTEFDFDNFEIHLYNRLGKETDFVIRENKNMEEYSLELDYKPIATRIIPQGSNELLLPEYFVDSPDIAMYSEIYYKHVEFPDIGIDEENGVTEEIAIGLLRDAAMKMFTENHIDKPVLSWTIGFDDGQDNPKIPDQLKKLLKLDLGDSVRAYKRGLTQMLEARIVEYNYNFVKGKYKDISISNKSQSFTVSIDKTVSEINLKVDSFVSIVSNVTKDLYSKIEQTEESILLEVKNVKEGLESSINQTAESIKLEVKDVKTGLESSITQLAGEIELKVEKDGIISAINQTAETIKIQASKIELTGYVTLTDLKTSGSTVINGSNITTGSISADRISGGLLTSINNDLRFNLDEGRLGIYSNNTLLATALKMKENKSGKYGMGILASNNSFISLGLGDNDDNTVYKPYIALANKITGTEWESGINLLTTVHGWFNHLKNFKLVWDGFKRSSNDSIILYSTNQNSTDSKLIMELANDYKTSFEIVSKMYNSGEKTVASFRGTGGSEYNSSDQYGINFYESLNMHGCRVSGIQALSAIDASTETLNVAEISVETMASAFVAENNVDYTVPISLQSNMESFGSATLIAGYCLVELPLGFTHAGYTIIICPHSSGNYRIKNYDDCFEVFGDIESFDYIIKGITG